MLPKSCPQTPAVPLVSYTRFCNSSTSPCPAVGGRNGDRCLPPLSVFIGRLVTPYGVSGFYVMLSFGVLSLKGVVSVIRLLAP